MSKGRKRFKAVNAKHAARHVAEGGDFNPAEHYKYRRSLLGKMGAASPVRKIDPKTGLVIE